MSAFSDEHRHQRTVADLDVSVQQSQSFQLTCVEQLAGDLLAQAADVFGSREAAAEWLMLPAMALNQDRPIDLLATVEGRKQVELLLIRLHYGVYT